MQFKSNLPPQAGALGAAWASNGTHLLGISGWRSANGSWQANHSVLSTVAVISADAVRWQVLPLPTAMPPRHGAVLAWMNGGWVFSAGATAAGQLLHDVWTWKGAAGTSWERLVTSQLPARAYTCAQAMPAAEWMPGTSDSQSVLLLVGGISKLPAGPILPNATMSSPAKLFGWAAGAPLADAWISLNGQTWQQLQAAVNVSGASATWPGQWWPTCTSWDSALWVLDGLALQQRQVWRIQPVPGGHTEKPVHASPPVHPAAWVQVATYTPWGSVYAPRALQGSALVASPIVLGGVTQVHYTTAPFERTVGVAAVWIGASDLPCWVQGATCAAHGTCLPSKSTAQYLPPLLPGDVCVCEHDWAQPACVAPQCGVCVHGTCKSLVTGGSRCSCEAGWTGMACDVPMCVHGCVHGTCASPGLCMCDMAWTGLACGSESPWWLAAMQAAWWHATEMSLCSAAAGVLAIGGWVLAANGALAMFATSLRRSRWTSSANGPAYSPETARSLMSPVRPLAYGSLTPDLSLAKAAHGPNEHNTPGGLSMPRMPAADMRPEERRGWAPAWARFPWHGDSDDDTASIADSVHSDAHSVSWAELGAPANFSDEAARRSWTEEYMRRASLAEMSMYSQHR